MLAPRVWWIGWLALAWLGLAAPPAWPADEQRIAAVVNDEVVSVRDLSDRLELVMLTSSIRDSEQARARLAPQVLRGLIEESLQLQEANRLGLEVTEAEIQNALASIAERNQLTVERMRSYLVESGVNFETLLRQVRAQIAWIKVVNRVIRPTVTVTVDQLDLAVQEARRSEGQPEYLLSEIVLPVDSPAQARARRAGRRPPGPDAARGGELRRARAAGFGRGQRRARRRSRVARRGRDPAGAARHSRPADPRRRSPIRWARRSATTSSGCAISGSPRRRWTPTRPGSRSR